MNANQPHETGPVRPRHWDFSTFFAGLLLLYMAILAGGAIALDTARGTLSAADVHRLYTLHAEDAP